MYKKNKYFLGVLLICSLMFVNCQAQAESIYGNTMPSTKVSVYLTRGITPLGDTGELGATTNNVMSSVQPTLPKTNERSSLFLSKIGEVLLIFVGVILLFCNRRTSKKKKDEVM